VRDHGGCLSLTPRLPAEWRSLDFSVRFHDRQLRVHLSHDEEQYLLDEGQPLEVTIRGEPRLLSPGQKLAVVPPG
jgi:alpha,alpha-trehalose phosphorylase